MPTFTRKVNTVEARQHLGPSFPVSSHLKGDQYCSTGDFLVVDPDTAGGKGSIYVIPKAQFLHDFDAKDEAVVPSIAGDQGFDVPTDPLIAGEAK